MAASMTIAMRPLSPAKYGLLFVVSCSALLAEAVLSFPFYFAPGWANGWPGGLTIYRVWSTWLTITLFVMLMTAGVGVASLISLLACIFPGGSRHSSKVLTILIAIWAILSVTTCSWAFSAIYSSTPEMWPNGYPG
jgi:hypothetical protein